MLSITEYKELENGVRSLVEQSLDEVCNKCPKGYIQLLAGADYEPLYEHTDLSPYVIDTPDRLFAEMTRVHNMLESLNAHYERIRKQVPPLDITKEVTVQLQTYSHIWESAIMQKLIRRVVHMLSGKAYEWKISSKTNTGSFMEDVIKKSLDNPFGLFLSAVYDKDWRNDFAHTSFYVDERSSMLCNAREDGMIGNRRMPLSEWEAMFLKASMLSFYLSEAVIERRNALPEETRFIIPMPMKSNPQNIRSICIYTHLLEIDDKRRIYFNFR